jgi:peptidylprolyl isomerase
LAAKKSNKSKSRGPSNRTRPRTAAAVRARQRRQRRRSIVTSAAAVAIVIVLVLLLVGGNFGSSTSTTSTSTSSSSTSTSSTTPPLPSVAGKPCVALSGPLPKGAPAVPVQTGRPPTTLVTKDLKIGTGAVVKAGQTLSVDYIGVACSSGKIFDSSYASGQPASFALSGVIPGWQQGIPGMRVGGERLLGIPPKLAYGDTGQGSIAPGETLWFVVHVLSAK